MHTPRDIAIIGCGMAGLSAARQLADAGLPVQLFDKARGSGGRLGSRRSEHGDFDLGAPWFTARDRAFREVVHQWQDSGCLQLWPARLYQIDEGGVLAPSPDAQERFVGVPRMSALSRHLLGDLPVQLGCRISTLQQHGSHWQLVDSEGHQHGPFAAVIVAVPPAQAAPLLEAAPHLASAAASVPMEPTWTAAFAFEQPLDTPVDGCFVRSGVLDWLSRNAGKPGRTSQPDAWVVHASSAWSQQHLQLPAEEVAERLRGALAEALGCVVPAALYSVAHRWLYARATQAHQWGALADTRLGLYACGDWCLAGRVEGAWLSGREAARRLLAQLQQPY